MIQEAEFHLVAKFSLSDRSRGGFDPRIKKDS